MADLTIGGLGVNVQRDGVEENQHEIGGARRRVFDGSYKSTVRTRKREWPITTVLLTSAEKTALELKLNGTPPQACSGAALGGAAVNCFPEYIGATYVPTLAGVRYRLRFNLHEA